MNAAAHLRDSARTGQSDPAGTAPRFVDGAAVVLLRPRKLRGTTGILRRRMPGGWEVEIRSPEGIPLHLTLPERAMHLRP